jgi:hypothetical protein
MSTVTGPSEHNVRNDRARAVALARGRAPNANGEREMRKKASSVLACERRGKNILASMLKAHR